MKPTLKTIASQPSWVIRSDSIELAVTQLGGHMAPVTFYRRHSVPVQPYYVCPWHDEGLKIAEPVLVPLRGDFFCMPFGGGSVHQGRKHFTHGESAAKKWKLLDAGSGGGVSSLVLEMKTTNIPGRVTKTIQLVDGQNVVYKRHVLEGYSVRTSLGHHATLAMPQEPGTVNIATSPMRLMGTPPTPVGDPTIGHYQSLAIGKRFADLSRVPLIWSEPPSGDCSSLPQREGFTDLLGLYNAPAAGPAWSAATFARQGYLWFSLKDAAVLPATLLWISNRGRHSVPWLGRNRCLGIEDVCGYFAEGLDASVRANPLSKAGIPTCVKLWPRRPTAVNYIQGVTKIPRGFSKVRSVSFAPGRATFTAVGGQKVTVDVCHEFLTTGEIS